MSTASTYDEDEQGKVLHSNFQKLQTAVVSGRNAVIILRNTVSLAIERLRRTEAQLKVDEIELAHLHRILHPDEE